MYMYEGSGSKGHRSDPYQLFASPVEAVVCAEAFPCHEILEEPSQEVVVWCLKEV